MVKSSLLILLFFTFCLSDLVAQSYVRTSSFLFSFREGFDLLEEDCGDNRSMLLRMDEELSAIRSRIEAGNYHLLIVAHVSAFNYSNIGVVNKASRNAGYLRAYIISNIDIPAECMAFYIDRTELDDYRLVTPIAVQKKEPAAPQDKTVQAQLAGPRWGISTNLLYWAILTPNLTLGGYFGNAFSFHVEGVYADWQAKGQHPITWSVWEVSPELRYWLWGLPTVLGTLRFELQEPDIIIRFIAQMESRKPDFKPSFVHLAFSLLLVFVNHNSVEYLGPKLK